MTLNMPAFFVLECVIEGPEVTEFQVRHEMCEVCDLRRSHRIGSTTVLFSRKAQLVDFTSTARGLLVSQRVINHFNDHLIAGWRAGYVTVRASKRLQPLDYCELVIVGHTRGYAQHVNLLVEETCSTCQICIFRRPQQGLVIPHECWDGSDIFIIDELPGLTIVTDRVRQVIERYNLKGVECTPIIEWRDPLGWLEKMKKEAEPGIWPPLKMVD